MNMCFKGHEPLMMFYLLPEEIVARTEIADFPRDPYIVLDDPQWREILGQGGRFICLEHSH